MRKLLAAIAFLSAASQAGAYQVGRWNLGGFVDQTLMYTTDNNFFGASDDSLSSDMHEVALLGRGPVASNLEFSGQILSRDAGAADNDKPRLDFAFLSYTLFENMQWTDVIRFGRVKRPSAVYADSRESPFSRPGVIMPQGIYYDRIRNVLVSYDGMDAFVERRVDLASYTVHAGAGIARPVDEEINDLFILRDAMLGNLQPRNTHHVQFVYDYDSGHFRISGAYFKLHYNYDPLTADPFLANGKANLLNEPGEYYFVGKTIGFEYNQTTWSLVSELAEGNTLFNGFARFFKNKPVVSRGGYIQANYNLTTSAQAYFRYDESHIDETNVYSDNLLFRMVGFKHWATTFYDRAMGLSWLATPALQIRTELHTVKGTGYLNIGDTESPSDLRKNWNMAVCEIAYRF